MTLAHRTAHHATGGRTNKPRDYSWEREAMDIAMLDGFGTMVTSEPLSDEQIEKIQAKSKAALLRSFEQTHAEMQRETIARLNAYFCSKSGDTRSSIGVSG